MRTPTEIIGKVPTGILVGEVVFENTGEVLKYQAVLPTEELMADNFYAERNKKGGFKAGIRWPIKTFGEAALVKGTSLGVEIMLEAECDNDAVTVAEVMQRLQNDARYYAMQGLKQIREDAQAHFHINS